MLQEQERREQQNEQPDQFKDLAGTLSIEESNKVQLKLIKDSGMDPSDWVGQNAKYFREIAQKQVFPAGQYENNPGEVEKFFKEKLKEKETGIMS